MTSIFSASPGRGQWLIRADFSDEEVWRQVGAAAAVNENEWPPRTAAETFEVVDDPRFAGLTADGLIALEPFAYDVFFIVDDITISHPDRPILTVDLHGEVGRTFRLIPAEVQLFAPNMIIANLAFADFADMADPDGVFRGFGLDPKTPINTTGPITSAAEAATAVQALRFRAARPGLSHDDRQRVAHEAVRLCTVLNQDHPEDAWSALLVADELGHPQLVADNAVPLARRFMASSPVSALVVFAVAARSRDDITTATADHEVRRLLRTLDPVSVVPALRERFSDHDPADVINLAGWLERHGIDRHRPGGEECALLLLRLIADTDDPEAKPAALLRLAQMQRWREPPAAQAALEAAVAAGHAEYSPQAAFDLAELLRGVDTAGAQAALRLAIASSHARVSASATVTLGQWLWEARDFDGAERAFRAALASGDSYAAHPSRHWLEELLAQGRDSVTARGRLHRGARPEHDVYAAVDFPWSPAEDPVPPADAGRN